MFRPLDGLIERGRKYLFGVVCSIIFANLKFDSKELKVTPNEKYRFSKSKNVACAKIFLLLHPYFEVCAVVLLNSLVINLTGLSKNLKKIGVTFSKTHVVAISLFKNLGVTGCSSQAVHHRLDNICEEYLNLPIHTLDEK